MGKKLTKFVGIRVTEKMYRELEEMAEGLGVRVADLGRWALAKLLIGSGFRLWRDWIEHSDGNPYCGDDEKCFFCGKRLTWGHSENCVYVKACEMLGVEPQ